MIVVSSTLGNKPNILLSREIDRSLHMRRRRRIHHISRKLLQIARWGAWQTGVVEVVHLFFLLAENLLPYIIIRLSLDDTNVESEIGMENSPESDMDMTQ